MVYCGPPSKACQRCRTRRIKCDLVQPSCSQCRRANRTCSGYRDQLDLVFRDQSDDVAYKVQQASSGVGKYPKRAAPTRHKVLARSGPLERVQIAVAPAKPIHVPYVDQAAGFFFKTYDSEAAESVKSVYKYIPYLYDAFQDSALSSVITALGLAGLSRYGNAPDMMSLATSNYHTALRQIRAELQDPVAVKTDQTLLSVYLLGLYETNTCSNLQSMKAWCNHIKGAIVLLQLRGEQQLQTEIGRRLFVQLRIQIQLHCITNRIPVPGIVRKLNEVYCSTAHGEQATAYTRFLAFVASFCELRALLATASSRFVSAQVIPQAVSLANDLELWAGTLSSNLLGHLGNHCYRDLCSAVFHNNYRMLLILVHWVILSQIAIQGRYTARDQAQIQKSRALTLSMISGVCGSVSYHTSLCSPDPRQPCVAAVNAIMWPLFVAGDANLCPQMTRAWIVDQLKTFGLKTGVQQPVVLAEITSQGQELTDLLMFEYSTTKVVDLWEDG